MNDFEAQVYTATSLVQNYLDATAQQRGYGSILSACSYVTSTNPKFAAEAQACVDFRDAVWTECYSILAQVEAGTLALTSFDQLLNMLPIITWPASS